MIKGQRVSFNPSGKKIVFFQHDLGIGPITTNNFRLGRWLLERGSEVELLGTTVHDAVYRYAPKGMSVRSLEAASLQRILIALVGYLAKTKPDIMIASGPNLHVLSCCAKKLTGYPRLLLLQIHSHTSSMFEDRSRLNRAVLVGLMRATHKWANIKISPSRGAADDWADLLGIKKGDISVLYNPAISDEEIEKSKKPVNHGWIGDQTVPVIVSVARLAPEKCLDKLLQALAIVANQRKVRLIILGEGPLRSDLETLASQLGLGQVVDFHGWVENPFSFMAKANLFVLSSRFEGFANAVAESLACGCPVVSTDAPSGPSEILSGGKYGRLVPVGDVHRLAEGILAGLDQQVDHSELHKRGMRFHVNRIGEDMIELLS